jgi:hypothetical protein
LDNNPVSMFNIGLSSKKNEYAKIILALSDKLLCLDGKSVEYWKEDIYKE